MTLIPRAETCVSARGTALSPQTGRLTVLVHSTHPRTVPDPATGDPAGYQWAGGDELDVPTTLGRELVAMACGFTEPGGLPILEPDPGAPPGWTGVIEPDRSPLLGVPEDQLVTITEPAAVSDPSTIQGPIQVVGGPGAPLPDDPPAPAAGGGWAGLVAHIADTRPAPRPSDLERQHQTDQGKRTGSKRKG